jgi:hypothetical protein
MNPETIELTEEGKKEFIERVARLVADSIMEDLLTCPFVKPLDKETTNES